MPGTFGRFGNMNPPAYLSERPYSLAVDPFRLMGNLYFVGTAQQSSHLIDTGDGLVLLDVSCIQDLPFLIDNIWKLDFDPRDIKLVIVSHAHVDHYGSINAFKKLVPTAKVAISAVDANELVTYPEAYDEFAQEFGPFNESFVPDFTLEDGQAIEVGDTKIRCVLIPGHTLGAMAHFWECHSEGRSYRVGIYGGAGFLTLQDSMMKRFHYPPTLQDDFLASIEKVWDEPVDIMLGNHPFHNDTWKKRAQQQAGNANAFVDPTEWHRYLTELREGYEYFLSLTPEEAANEMKESRFMEYTGKYLGL